MRPVSTICASAILAFASLAASADGGGGGGGGDGGGGGGDGMPGLVVSDPDYQAAMAAVKGQDWKQVVARMTAFVQRSPNNADAWNELGHAYRKMGDMDNSFKHYAKALQIDPKHRGAHEYLGEAYLLVGDLPRAEQELRALDSLCFFPCEQYRDLKEKVRRYKAERATSAAR